MADAPKFGMVWSVAMLSCVDTLQGDEEDVAARPENINTVRF